MKPSVSKSRSSGTARQKPVKSSSLSLEQLLMLDGVFLRAHQGKPRLDRALPTKVGTTGKGKKPRTS